MSLGNRGDTRFLYWAIALSLIVLIAASSIAVLVSTFKSASHEAAVRTEFAYIIGQGQLIDKKMSGSFTLPIDPTQ